MCKSTGVGEKLAHLVREAVRGLVCVVSRVKMEDVESAERSWGGGGPDGPWKSAWEVWISWECSAWVLREKKQG